MFNHIYDAIKTPHIIKIEEYLYIARFESMKIYSTVHAVKRLLKARKINKYSVLIDSSSGTYAYALACHKYGLRCHLVVSKTVDNSIRLQLELLGAIVEAIPYLNSLKLDQNYRVEKVKAILEKNHNYYWMQQYHDDIHYGGYREFAQLIKEQLNVDNLTVVGGVGSGCSTGGLATGLKELGVDVKLCGVQPFGSVTFGAEHVNDPEIIVAGIGSAIEFLNVRHNLYYSINWISFDYSLSGTIDLIKKHAIFAGLSTGSAWYVGKLEKRKHPNTPCLIIAPDTGHRYVDSVYSRHSEAFRLISSNLNIFTVQENYRYLGLNIIGVANQNQH